jgi:hypothetical protein
MVETNYPILARSGNVKTPTRKRLNCNRFVSMIEAGMFLLRLRQTFESLYMPPITLPASCQQLSTLCKCQAVEGITNR